jgi:glycosyltransferase involved in cell wall biosynthesis
VGYYREDFVRELRHNLVDNMLLHGPKDPPVMPRYYRSAMLTINPSLRETFSMVNLECLASSRPVITVNNGGGSELITHGKNGYICDANPKSIIKYVYDWQQTIKNTGKCMQTPTPRMQNTIGP